MTSSEPYTNPNGVSPIAFLGVVRTAHKTLSSSFIHLPLRVSNLYFNPFKIILFAASSHWFEDASVKYGDAKFTILHRTISALFQRIVELCGRRKGFYFNPFRKIINRHNDVTYLFGLG